jgi:hypothetical protein
MGDFDWLITKNINKALDTPKIDTYIVICSFGLFHRVQRVRWYWEHVGEQIGNLRNMLRIHWELDENTLGTT